MILTFVADLYLASSLALLVGDVGVGKLTDQVLMPSVSLLQYLKWITVRDISPRPPWLALIRLASFAKIRSWHTPFSGLCHIHKPLLLFFLFLLIIVLHCFGLFADNSLTLTLHCLNVNSN